MAYDPASSMMMLLLVVVIILLFLALAAGRGKAGGAVTVLLEPLLAVLALGRTAIVVAVHMAVQGRAAAARG